MVTVELCMMWMRCHCLGTLRLPLLIYSYRCICDWHGVRDLQGIRSGTRRLTAAIHPLRLFPDDHKGQPEVLFRSCPDLASQIRWWDKYAQSCRDKGLAPGRFLSPAVGEFLSGSWLSLTVNQRLPKGWTIPKPGKVEKNDVCRQVIKSRIEDGYAENAPVFSDVQFFICLENVANILSKKHREVLAYLVQAVKRHRVFFIACKRGRFQKLFQDLSPGLMSADDMRKRAQRPWNARARVPLASWLRAEAKAEVYNLIREAPPAATSGRLQRPKLAAAQSRLKDKSNVRMLPPGTFTDYLRILNSRLDDEEQVWSSDFGHLLAKCGQDRNAREAQTRLFAAHLQKQYSDRVQYWKCRSESRLRNMLPGGHQVLCIIMDAIDHAKFRFPRSAIFKGKELSTYARPCLDVMGTLAHGYSATLALSLPHVMKGRLDLRTTSVSLHSDNTCKETKNNTLLRDTSTSDNNGTQTGIEWRAGAQQNGDSGEDPEALAVAAKGCRQEMLVNGTEPKNQNWTRLED
ncbi:unnamed protein product [Symbiodinium microadriaticum]|nr:unnamed protein product [Symbiodinium microadriaticum]